MSTKTSRRPIRGEWGVVRVVTAFLASEGYRVRHEVSNMGQSVDVVATRGRWITAIEAKRKDWRRALDQCRAHTVVADYVCVALCAEEPSPRLIAELAQSGFGLLLVSPSSGLCRWHSAPQRNRSVWEPQRRRLSASMRGVEYVR